MYFVCKIKIHIQFINKRLSNKVMYTSIGCDTFRKVFHRNCTNYVQQGILTPKPGRYVAICSTLTSHLIFLSFLYIIFLELCSINHFIIMTVFISPLNLGSWSSIVR